LNHKGLAKHLTGQLLSQTLYGEGRGAAVIGRLQIPHGFQIVLLAHTKTVSSKVGEVVTPLGPWSTVGQLFFGCRQQDLPRQSFLVDSGHMAKPTWLGFLHSEER